MALAASPYDFINSFDLIDLRDPEPADCSTPTHNISIPPTSLDEDDDLISFDSPPRTLSQTKFSPLSPPFYASRPVPGLLEQSPTRASQPVPKIENVKVAKFSLPAHVYQSSTISTPPRAIFTNPNKSYTVQNVSTSSQELYFSEPLRQLRQLTSVTKPSFSQKSSENTSPIKLKPLRFKEPSKVATTSSKLKLKQKTQIKLSHLFPDGPEKAESETGKKRRAETSDVVIRRIVGRELGVNLRKKEDERSLEIERALREGRRGLVKGHGQV